MAEADDQYQRCKFSLTCKTDDIVIVHCLRAISEYCEQGVRKQLAWGGTKSSEWRNNDNKIKLHFSQPAYRNRFVENANRILPPGSWSEIERDDKDPQVRQRQRGHAT